MGKASHYVFKDLERMMRNEDYEKLYELSQKYKERYQRDPELRQLCNKLAEKVVTEDFEEIHAFQEDIQKMIDDRKIDRGPRMRRGWYR